MFGVVSDETEPGSPRIYLVIGVVALLAVGAWWLFDDPEPPPPEQSMGPVEVDDEPAPPPDPPILEPPPAPEPPEPDYDELAQVLFDGSVPEEVAPYDPPLPTTGFPETPEEAAARREAMRARQEAEREEEAPREPGTPAEQLRAATAWRGLLESRVETLRAQLEEAEASGDEARAARARRLIERLEGQRPGLNRSIRRLQATVGPM